MDLSAVLWRMSFSSCDRDCTSMAAKMLALACESHSQEFSSLRNTLHGSSICHSVMKVENGARICGWLKPAKRPRVNEWLPMSWSCAASAASATFQVSNWCCSRGESGRSPPHSAPHTMRCARSKRPALDAQGSCPGPSANEKAKTIRS
jgi:hypothetical protein